ncbi:MAG: hypothetical protein HGB26_08230 [Desulfobulbaceae bacterium]|nr:hypothetical protein [Desulfobulbaceae bacterium]
MPVNPLTQDPRTVVAPQSAAKGVNKTQATDRASAAVTPQPSAKDTVTISKAAETLQAAKEDTSIAATKSPRATSSETDKTEKLRDRSMARQSAAEEIQKSASDNSQRTQGISRISMMI